MVILFSQEILKKMKKIKNKDPKLFKHVQKQLITFEKNPKHHSLRAHKLTGQMKNYWSISINLSVRMVNMQTSDNEVFFYDIGTHDEIYR